MPIRSLESFLFESKLVSTSSIEILENATIGIDVEHYLSRIYTYKKEQFLFGIGGTPSSLSTYIESDLKVFKEFNVKPLFVIPGLKLSSQHELLKYNELSPQEQHLDTTWKRLQSKHSIVSGNPFGYIGESFRFNVEPLPISPMINDLVRLFIKNNIDYLICPYDASFQLSYLYEAKIIDCIYGSTDILLTTTEKFILGMEFQSKDFRFVDKRKVLAELSLSERQFQDLSIMVGCSIQPETFSNLPQLPKHASLTQFQQLNYFRIALDILYQYNTFVGRNSPDIFGYISSFGDPRLKELYYRGHACIKFMPVLITSGQIELYATEMNRLGLTLDSKLLKPSEETKTNNQDMKVPAELHVVISQRLPSEFYFYQSIGLIPSKLLDAITSGKLIMRPPLEIETGSRYKALLTSTKFQNILDWQFNLITQLLTRYYQVKKIEVMYWFKDAVIELNNRLVPPVAIRISDVWSAQALGSQFSMHKFWDESAHKSVKIDLAQSSPKDLVSTSFLRSLFVMGVVTGERKMTNVQKIMCRLSQENCALNDKSIESLLLILLLIKEQGFRALSEGEGFSSVPRSFKDCKTKNEIEKRQLRLIDLISRIYSLEKLHIHPINYQGPISRSILGFRSQLKFIQETLHNSVQVCLTDLIVRNEDVKLMLTSKNLWGALIEQLPFYTDLSNTLMGVFAEIFFESALTLSAGDKSKDLCAQESKKHLMEDILQVAKPTFNINLKSVNSVTLDAFTKDFSNATDLWNSFVQLMRITNEIDPTMVTIGDISFVEAANTIVSDFHF